MFFLANQANQCLREEKMKNKGDSRKDRKKKKRKQEQMSVFGHSSKLSKVNPEKIHKQKKHRNKKSHKKYDKGGTR